MIDKKFDQGLLYTLDGLLIEESFRVLTNPNEFRDRIYQRGNYSFGISSAKSEQYLKKGNLNFTGFDIDFQVEGVINGRSYDDYIQDVVKTIHQINQEVSELGIKVDGGAIWDLNHVKKGEVNIKFWYKKGSKPKEVAQAVVITQKELFSIMANYIMPEAVSSDATYLRH